MVLLIIQNSPWKQRTCLSSALLEDVRRRIQRAHSSFLARTKALLDAGINYDEVEQAFAGYVYGVRPEKLEECQRQAELLSPILAGLDLWSTSSVRSRNDCYTDRQRTCSHWDAEDCSCFARDPLVPFARSATHTSLPPSRSTTTAPPALLHSFSHVRWLRPASASVSWRLVSRKCAFAVPFGSPRRLFLLRLQMAPGSLTTTFNDRAPPLGKTIELMNDIVGIGQGPFGSSQSFRVVGPLADSVLAGTAAQIFGNGAEEYCQRYGSTWRDVAAIGELSLRGFAGAGSLIGLFSPFTHTLSHITVS